MRPITKLFILIALAFSSFYELKADVQFVLTPPSTGAVGSIITVPITVFGFDSIEQFQFAVDFDSTKYEYVSAANVITGLTMQRFPANPAFAATQVRASFLGEIHFPSFDVHTTLSNGTVICNLRLRVKSTPLGEIKFSQIFPVTASRFIPPNSSFQYFMSISSDGHTLNGGSTPPLPQGFLIYTEGATGYQGQQVQVPVYVNGCVDIQAIIYSIEWDTDVLNFVSLTPASPVDMSEPFDTSLVGFDQLNYNATTAQNGYINTTWPDIVDLGQYINPDPFGPYFWPQLPDQTLIYTLTFDVIGAPGTFSEILFNDVGLSGGTPPTAEDLQGNNMWNAVGDTVFVQSAPPPSDIVTFEMEKDTVFLNDQVCLDVKVRDFENVSNFELTFQYDHTKLQFDEIPGPVFIDGELMSWNHNATNHWVRVLWNKPSNPVTLANDSTIFEVCFNSTGAVGSIANVNWTVVDPLKPNIVGVNYGPAGLNLINGHVYVTNAVAPCVGVQSKTDVTCFGGNNGAINLQRTCTNQTSNNYTYVWSGPNNYTATTEDISGLVAGTYTVTVTSSNGGLTATATAMISQPAEIAFNQSLVTVEDISCHGEGDGQITWPVSALTGGTSPYTYAWTGPGGPYTTRNLTNLSAGTYSLVITDANSCTKAAGTFTVSEPAEMAFDQTAVTKQNVSCFGGTDGRITWPVSALTGGTSPYTYAWTGPGGPYTTRTLVDVGQGTYSLIITDANGCTVGAGAHTLTQPTTININTSTIVTTNIQCGGSNGSIVLNNAVSGGTGPYSYAWSGPNNFSATTKDLTGLSVAGCYTFTVTDGKGCSLVSQPFCITSLGGTPITVTLDGVTNESCSGANNGGINISATGGVAPLRYEWYNINPSPVVSTQQDPTGLAAGVYYVLVYDANGCGPSTLSNNVTINTNPNTIEVSAAWTDVTCPGGNDGTITLTVTGGTAPFTYQSQPNLPGWPNPTGLMAGNYQATVTDANGCTASSQMVTIDQPEPITITLVEKIDVSCNGGNNGKITVDVTGGTQPYTIVWGGLQGMMISNLEAGNYRPTVTDASGCTKQGTNITVNEPPALVVTLDNVTDATGTMCDGAINLSVSGGVAPYTYAWSGGLPSQQDQSGVCAGTYSVTVTDDNDCVYIMDDIVVEATQTLMIKILAAQASCSGANGCFDIAISGGAPPYVINWTKNNSPLNGSFTTTMDTFTECSFPSGFINLTVTDASSATASTSDLIDALQAPAPTIIPNDPFDDAMNGTIEVIPPSGAVYTYQWDPAIHSGNQLMNLDSGTYVVTITNMDGGCTLVQAIVLQRDYALFREVITVELPVCGGVCDGEIAFFAEGGDGPTYNWTITSPNGFSLDTMTFTPNQLVRLRDLCPGEYTILNTDESGIVRTFAKMLTPQSNITATDTILSEYSGFDVSGAASCDGRVRVFPTDGAEPYEFNWSNGGSNQTNNQLCVGDYEVTITDNVGCTHVVTGTLTAPDALIPSLVALSDFNGYNISCKGERDGLIQVSTLGGVAPYEVEWSNGQADLLSQSNSFAVLEQMPAGTYSVTITDENGVSTTADVDLVEPEPMVIQFQEQRPSSIANCDGEFKLTAANAAGDVIFNWSRINGDPKSGMGSSVDELCAGHIIQVTAEDENQCLAVGRDTIGYPDDGCFQLSPIITPGSVDGDNDFLLVSCIESAKTHHLEIFNRWGQLVFETENYDNFSNTWKGTNRRGQPLPEGVYFYVLDFTNDMNEPMQLKGYIDLIR